MGVVLKESYKNTFTLLLAVLVGAINTLFLYVYFLEMEYYGLITFILSSAFIVRPLIALGVNHSIIKFFSAITTKSEKDKFLSTALWLPLFVIIPFVVLGVSFYDCIATQLSKENALVKNYTYLILLIGIATAYFEIFYAWARVHLKSVFGNVLKELFVRVSASLLLVAVYFKVINSHQFVLALVGVYFLQTLLMLFFALKLYRPKFSWAVPANFREIIKYSLYIILSGSAATILIDIDKFMIPQKETIAQVAFYAVAVYIGSVIEIPGRAMSQIMQPLTAKAMNANHHKEVVAFYQKSSINLIVISGLLFVLINTNIQSLYQLLPTQYTAGVWVVFMISVAKLYHMFLGNNGAIISTSKHYKVLLPYGITMALTVIVLNNWFIDVFGVNGAALATLLVVLVFNSIKLGYVYVKFNMQPTSSKTWIALLVITLCTVLGLIVNFNVHPVLAILIKTIVLSSIYLFCVIQFRLSSDINKVYQNVRSKVK